MSYFDGKLRRRRRLDKAQRVSTGRMVDRGPIRSFFTLSWWH
ncbi:MAG: hypothetical protein WC581_02595 [Thermodesulfovibrionales bacterium]